jgi:hypothetical protein
MSELKITTNNVPRDVLSGHDLTEAERAEIDYRDWSVPDDEDGNGGDGWDGRYVRYKGTLYDLDDLDSRGGGSVAGWDGYKGDSFFSGVVFRYPRDGREIDFERVICGTYYQH